MNVNRSQSNSRPIRRSTRREFLRNTGLGFGSLALNAMLDADGLGSQIGDTERNLMPHFAPKAKSVIWLFMIGGTSHVESFDPKPALNKFAGKTIAETPFGDILESKFLENERVVAFDPNNGFIRTTCYPMQVGFSKRGNSGLEISVIGGPMSVIVRTICA